MSRGVLPVVVIVAAGASGVLMGLALAPGAPTARESLAPSPVARNPAPNRARPKKRPACVEGQRCWNWALVGDRTRPIFDTAGRARRGGGWGVADRRGRGVLAQVKGEGGG